MRSVNARCGVFVQLCGFCQIHDPVCSTEDCPYWGEEIDSAPHTYDDDADMTCNVCGYSYYTIEATAGAGGSISPSGNVSVREGGDQTFTITPDKGYAVSNVKIDGKSIGAVKSYTFENVSRAHTIEVIFVKGTASANTGDSSNLPLWSITLITSLAGCLALAAWQRRRRREEKALQSIEK